MKKIFRKNQLIITALALMIAVAGYFSCMHEDIDDADIAAEASGDLLDEDFEISDEDMMDENDIFVAEEGESITGTETAFIDGQVGDAAGEVTDGEGVAAGDTASTGEEVAAEGDAVTAENGTAVAENQEIENPGEAVLTSSTVSNVDYASEMKLSREQVRSKNKETLLEVVNNTTISDELKQEAINKMIALTDIAERENAAEMMLEAKGFTDVVVSISDDTCDVVLNMGDVTDAKRAQVEDIVKRKTNISGENIIITPIVITEEEGE